MKQQFAPKTRKDLETGMAKVFSAKIKGLSVELQKILLDDMVTAFENRLAILDHAQTKNSS